MFEMTSNDVAYVAPYCVFLNCDCGNETYIETDKLETINDKYCVLKDNVTVTCPKCGKSQSAPDKYIPKKAENSANVRHLPECPVCHSLDVHKIGNVKKISSFAVMGVFSSNIGKTMECKSCGYKF